MKITWLYSDLVQINLQSELDGGDKLWCVYTLACMVDE